MAIARASLTKKLRCAIIDLKYDDIDTYVINFSSVQHADEAIDILNARDDIKYAEPNYYITFESEEPHE